MLNLQSYSLAFIFAAAQVIYSAGTALSWLRWFDRRIFGDLIRSCFCSLLDKLQEVEEGPEQLPCRVEQRSSKRRDAQSRRGQREVQRRAQQQESEQVSQEEQTVPAAVPQHLPGTIWVQQPQWAQHAALGDHLGVADVKHGGLAVRRLVVFCLQNLGQKGQRETVEQHSERRIRVLQRVDACHLLGDCTDRDREGSRSFTGDAEAA